MSQLGFFDEPAPPPAAEEEDWFDSLPPGDDAPTDGARWYQTEAHNAILRSFNQGNNSALLVLATGLGKTFTFSMVAKYWQGRVLVCAHRDELVDQAREALERMTGELVEVEKAEYYAGLKARIVVGSTQTLAKRKERFPADHFSLVIPDEAHHYIAPSFKAVLDYFQEGGAKILGVTATPDRADEAAMGQAFDDVPYMMDIQDGIEHGYLVPVTGQRVHLDEIDLSGIDTTAGDLAVGQLDDAMLKAAEGIVRKTLELCPERQGIAFFPGVRSAEYAMLKFNELQPGSACFISGETDKDERKQIVKDFKAGRYKYLCNCAVATEGFDAPAASLIIQGRPTKSRSLYAQMIGRGTRTLPGLVDAITGKEQAELRRAAIGASAKPNCLILDFVGNSGRHTLMSPEDVLGGNYSPAEVAEAKKRAEKDGEGGDVLKNLRAARAALEAMAKKAQAKVKARVSPFDPFHALGMEVQDEERYATRFGGKPATEGQLKLLRDKGVPEEQLVGISKRAAGRLCDELKRRREAGLASYKQMRQLKKFGMTDNDITFQNANKAITYIASKQWRDIDTRTLYGIVHPER